MSTDLWITCDTSEHLHHPSPDTDIELLEDKQLSDHVIGTSPWAVQRLPYDPIIKWTLLPYLVPCVVWAWPTHSVWVYFGLAFPSLWIPSTVLWIPATAALSPTDNPLHTTPSPPANARTATDKQSALSPWQPPAHVVSGGWWSLAG